MSSTKTEYIVAANLVQDIFYLTKLVSKLDFIQKPPITILKDNQYCIKRAQSEKYYNKKKHIDIGYHLLKNLIDEEMIELQYVSSSCMIAYILTEALPRPKHFTALQQHYDQSSVRVSGFR